jgi:hypothetical protein
VETIVRYIETAERNAGARYRLPGQNLRFANETGAWARGNRVLKSIAGKTTTSGPIVA